MDYLDNIMKGAGVPANQPVPGQGESSGPGIFKRGLDFLTRDFDDPDFQHTKEGFAKFGRVFTSYFEDDGTPKITKVLKHNETGELLGLVNDQPVPLVRYLEHKETGQKFGMTEDGYMIQIERPEELDFGEKFARGVGHAGLRATGVMFGAYTFMWPLIFGFAEEQDKQAWAGNPVSGLPTSALKGLASSWEGIVEKGSFGTTATDYFKSVMGGQSVTDVMNLYLDTDADLGKKGNRYAIKKYLADLAEPTYEILLMSIAEPHIAASRIVSATKTAKFKEMMKVKDEWNQVRSDLKRLGKDPDMLLKTLEIMRANPEIQEGVNTLRKDLGAAWGSRAHAHNEVLGRAKSHNQVVDTVKATEKLEASAQEFMGRVRQEQRLVQKQKLGMEALEEGIKKTKVSKKDLADEALRKADDELVENIKRRVERGTLDVESVGEKEYQALARKQGRDKAAQEIQDMKKGAETLKRKVGEDQKLQADEELTGKVSEGIERSSKRVGEIEDSAEAIAKKAEARDLARKEVEETLKSYQAKPETQAAKEGFRKAARVNEEVEIGIKKTKVNKVRKEQGLISVRDTAPQGEASLVDLVTKPVRDFHANLMRDIGTRVEATMAKAKAYTGWKWDVGDRVKSNKTGKLYEITGRTWDKKSNSPRYNYKGISEEGEVSQFKAEMAHKQLTKMGIREESLEFSNAKDKIVKGRSEDMTPDQFVAGDVARADEIVETTIKRALNKASDTKPTPKSAEPAPKVGEIETLPSGDRHRVVEFNEANYDEYMRDTIKISFNDYKRKFAGDHTHMSVLDRGMGFRYKETGVLGDVTYKGKTVPKTVEPTTFKDIESASDELAGAQRGKPESAMLKTTRRQISQLYGNSLEHIGDISHRMSQHLARLEGSFEAVQSKVRSQLRYLRNEYGFKRETLEQIKSNVEYYKAEGRTVEGSTAELKKLSKVYANEHSKLPVYNEGQYHAREAAVSLGEWKFDETIRHLEVLEKELAKGEASWAKYTSQHTKDARGNIVRYGEAVQPTERELAALVESSEWSLSAEELRNLQDDAIAKAIPESKDITPGLSDDLMRLLSGLGKQSPSKLHAMSPIEEGMKLLGGVSRIIGRKTLERLAELGWRRKQAGVYQQPGASQANKMWRTIEPRPGRKRPVIFVPPESSPTPKGTKDVIRMTDRAAARRKQQMLDLEKKFSDKLAAGREDPHLTRINGLIDSTQKAIGIKVKQAKPDYEELSKSLIGLDEMYNELNVILDPSKYKSYTKMRTLEEIANDNYSSLNKLARRFQKKLARSKFTSIEGGEGTPGANQLESLGLQNLYETTRDVGKAVKKKLGRRGPQTKYQEAEVRSQMARVVSEMYETSPLKKPAEVLMSNRAEELGMTIGKEKKFFQLLDDEGKLVIQSKNLDDLMPSLNTGFKTAEEFSTQAWKNELADLILDTSNNFRRWAFPEGVETVTGEQMTAALGKYEAITKGKPFKETITQHIAGSPDVTLNKTPSGKAAFNLLVDTKNEHIGQYYRTWSKLDKVFKKFGIKGKASDQMRLYLDRVPKFDAAGKVIKNSKGEVQYQGLSDKITHKGVQQAGPEVRKVLDEVIAQAKEAGVDVKGYLQDYYPHRVPKVDLLRKGAKRKEILNATVAEGWFKNIDEAEKVLDSFISRLDMNRSDYRFFKWGVKKGLFEDTVQAELWWDRFISRDYVPADGSLVFSRKANIPFYDRNFLGSMADYLDGAIKTSVDYKMLGGKNHSKMTKLIEMVGLEKGNKDLMTKLLKTHLGLQFPQTTDGVRFLKGIQTLKLTPMSSMVNLTQNLAGGFMGGPTAFFRGLKKLATERGTWGDAQQFGAAANQVLRDIEALHTGGGKWTGHYVKAIGFTATESINRNFTALVGRETLFWRFGRLQKNLAKVDKVGKVRSKLINRQIKEDYRYLDKFGLDAKPHIDKGFLSEETVNRFSKRFSDEINFLGKEIDTPQWAVDSPVGQLAWQYKQFIYGQGKLMKRHVLGELKKGNIKPLLWVAAVYPAVGIPIDIFVNQFVFGKEAPGSAAELYWEGLTAVGGIGMISSMIDAARYGKLESALIGPTGGSIGKWGSIAVGNNRLDAKDIVEMIPFGLGRLGKAQIKKSKPKGRSRRSRRSGRGSRF